MAALATNSASGTSRKRLRGYQDTRFDDNLDSKHVLEFARHQHDGEELAMASPAWRDVRINRDKRKSGKRPIPGGITLDDFTTIQKYLADMFQDIEAGTGQ